ncbi:sugar O-acetyltransferase [Pseudokineococcus basanitobsidens]|uniref:Sugar O-acetyltransferase n=1 Tax=Pseudokineococcus basanitobsidens TaxID=1926649 RepID=A0ABU8RG97_9ACTN
MSHPEATATTTDAGDPLAGDPRSMAQRMRDGDWYRADDPEIAEAASLGMELADAFNATTARQGTLRDHLLRRLLGAVGDGTAVRPPLHVDYGSNVRIGARCFANFGLTALDVAAITIGDDVQIGPHVQLLTPTHPLDPDLRRAGWEAAAPITVEDGVWLGGGVVVCPGVTIGRDTVVGAGSVVTKDLPPRVVAVGSPARVVRSLDEPTAGPVTEQAR